MNKCSEYRIELVEIMLNDFDWFYYLRGDNEIFIRNMRELSRIKNELKKLPRVRVEELINKHRPQFCDIRFVLGVDYVV